MKTVLVTGGGGFIGKRLLPYLEAKGWKTATAPGRLSPESDWKPILAGANAVVHLAARVHRMKEEGPEAEAEYHRDNVELTRSLGRACLKAGVRRLVFLSSVKAMGEATAPGEKWNESSACRPQDAYGRSKLEAEKYLAELDGLAVILRPPLVYGPEVKANMARLYRSVARGFPLPLASVENSRSLLYLENLTDAIARALEHPKAAGQTFLLSDGEDLSTPELIRRVAASLGKTARLFPCPLNLLRLGAFLAGKSGQADRLLGSLALDTEKARNMLGWRPPFTMDAGLKATAEWYLTHEANL